MGLGYLDYYSSSGQGGTGGNPPPPSPPPPTTPPYSPSPSPQMSGSYMPNINEYKNEDCEINNYFTNSGLTITKKNFSKYNPQRLLFSI